MKQTAVEFLLRELGDKFPKEVQDLYVSNKDVFASICLQAEEMEKQQIMDARLDGCISYSGTEVALISDVVDTEQYCNEQFKNK